MKAERQHEKDVEELAYRSDLAKLFNEKKYFEDQIKILKNGYNLLTDEEKKGRDKQINENEIQLGVTQNNIQNKVSDRKKKKDDNGDTPFQRLAKEIVEISDGATNAVSTMMSVLQSAVDLEISIREKRVERLKSIAERGNAELLQLEENRLRRAQAQQEKYARAQIAINAAQQVSASLLAIANASSAGFGWGSIPLVLAVIGSLASGFAMVKSMTQDNVSGFKDGVVGLHGPGSETSDSIPARLSRGESVITAKGTNAGDNAEILRMMNDGMAFSVPNLTLKNNNAGVISPSEKGNEFNALKLEVSALHSAILSVGEKIENQKPSSITIDADGVASISNAVSIRNRKRDLL